MKRFSSLLVIGMMLNTIYAQVDRRESDNKNLCIDIFSY
jgi:hypothetical protein